MLWFKYKWLLIFSHGLCVKIIRAGQSIKILNNEIKGLLGRTMNMARGRMVLNRIMQLITTLESVIFSASALLYREEKDLIEFSEKVEDVVKKLLKKCKHDKRRYQADEKILRLKMEELKKHKRHLPRKLEKKVRKEKEGVDRNEVLKAKALSLLEQMIDTIKNIESRIYASRLEAKAQKRGTLNIYRVQETVIIRSNFRLGELIGRKGGIEAGALDKRIDDTIEIAKRQLKRFKYGEIEESEIKKLGEYARMEAKDLNDVIHFAILASQRVKGWLRVMNTRIAENPQLSSLRGEWIKAGKRFEELKGDIFTQVKRLDNELGISDIPINLLNELKKSV